MIRMSSRIDQIERIKTWWWDKMQMRFMTPPITVYPREIMRSDLASVKCCIGERNLQLETLVLSRQICLKIYVRGFWRYAWKPARQTYVVVRYLNGSDSKLYYRRILNTLLFHKEGKHFIWMRYLIIKLNDVWKFNYYF